jgi:Icc-related predicted phosphoesterase
MPLEDVRIAAVGDLHCARTSQGALERTFAAIEEAADVLVLCGDLTDYGLPEEAEILAAQLKKAITIPTVAVLGNHDFESRREKDVHDLLLAAGVIVLDGDACEVEGIGFAGVKGFGGGFGDRAVEAWGEPVLKAFVGETIQEALKLESALARLTAKTKVVVLHYAPIEATVQGEPTAIHPFLGSRRLEEPINRMRVDLVLHGHCHHGSLEGVTSTGIPVYNVAMPLLRRQRPGEPPFRVFTLPREKVAEWTPLGAAPRASFDAGGRL